MSYEILYTRQFIKINDNLFAPIILAGSNNCYECGRGGRDGRRDRSWWNDTNIIEHKQFASKEDILAGLDRVRQHIIDRNTERVEEAKVKGDFNEDVYNDERFGWWSSIAISGAHTSGTSFSMFKSFYLTGIKKALTVEQLVEGRVDIKVYSYYYNEESKKEVEAKGVKFLEAVYPKTTNDLLETVKIFEDNYKDTGFSWYVSFDGGRYTETIIKRLRNKFFPKVKKQKEYKTFAFFFVLRHITNGACFYKRTKYGYKYSPYDDGGKRFLTETQAKQMLKKLEKSYPKQFEVVRINKETHAYA